MRLELDDAQQAKQGFGQMAELAEILTGELIRVGCDKELREKMVLIWWKELISASMAPNLAELFKGITGGGSDA